MATDPDGVAVVEAGVGARPQPAHEEHPWTVGHDDVRDDLLEGGVVLDLGADAELADGSDGLQHLAHAVGPDAAPVEPARHAARGMPSTSSRETLLGPGTGSAMSRVYR